MTSNPMIKSARRALSEVLKVQAHESLLTISDREKQPIGEVFLEAAKSLGMQTDLYMLPEELRPLRDIPSDLLERLAGINVAITTLASLPAETSFRVALIGQLIKLGVRMGHSPGITEDMLLHGPMNIDYPPMVKRAQRLMQLFEEAASVHITAPRGTDITMQIQDRGWQTDVVYSSDGIANLPCGEIWCAPVENGANGTLVCDGSIGDFGMVPAPFKLTVIDGKITAWACDDKPFGSKVYEALTLDEEAGIIGELGIGVNSGARITGNLLEDEKAFETIHIAFGNNETMPGGQNRSQTHRDFLVRKPDITITYKDGSQRQVLTNGVLQLS